MQKPQARKVRRHIDQKTPHAKPKENKEKGKNKGKRNTNASLRGLQLRNALSHAHQETTQSKAPTTKQAPQISDPAITTR